MSVIGSNIIAGASGVVADTAYQISRSLRFNSADSAYLNRTPASAGNRKTMTLSIWLKRTAFGTQTHIFSAGTSGASNCDWLEFQADNTLRLGSYNGAFNFQYVTSQVFRDPSAFLHINVAIDTTNATSTDRIKISINGSRVTAFSTSSAPSLNADCPFFNTAVAHYIGKLVDQSVFINAYKADIRFIDGQALDPTSFGETDSATGVWVPKAYTGTYGTNGFWLKFDDNSGTTSTTLGKDSSGNGNNWTPNNFSVTAGVGNDSLVDTPTNYGTDTGAGGEVRGNYATWNPLFPGSLATLSNGNLDAVISSGTTVGSNTASSFGVSTGQWYFEATFFQSGSSTFASTLGVTLNPHDQSASSIQVGYGKDGQKYISGTGSAYGAAFVSGDVIGVALDLNAGTVVFYKNGVSQGTATTGLTGTYFPCIRIVRESSYSSGFYLNAGQRPFAYTAPSGFKALCTTNLPTPAVARGDSAFEVVTWTGDGVNGRVITSSLNFGPDFIWAKSRGSAAYHTLNDIVRGTNAILQSNTTSAEQVGSNGYVTAFNSNGFAVSGGSDINANATAFVGWLWDAGTSTVSNTSGTITSTIRANATAGISVVTYTGTGAASATVGHGIGVAPRMIFVKNRTGSADNWLVYTSTTGAGAYLNLNATGASTASTSPWANTSPTSSVFSVGAPSGTWTNANGVNYVAYCFAEVVGFSKIGSYTGNGSADGPFVFTGMRSRWVLIKRTDAAGDNWFMYDTARNTYNVADLRLYPNTSGAEASGINAMDILSNGFKLRTTDTSFNASGGTYIFAAFAEAPFNYARAR